MLRGGIAARWQVSSAGAGTAEATPWTGSSTEEETCGGTSRGQFLSHR